MKVGTYFLFILVYYLMYFIKKVTFNDLMPLSGLVFGLYYNKSAHT